MPLIKFFRSPQEICGVINAYFASVGINSIITPRNPKSKIQAKNKEIETFTIADSETTKPELPTLTGLALFMGFQSLEDFETYEQKGRHGYYVRRARLQIIAAYERKLHSSNSTGVIFALKSLKWNERSVSANSKNLTVKIVESGPAPAGNEKEVIL